MVDFFAHVFSEWCATTGGTPEQESDSDVRPIMPGVARRRIDQLTDTSNQPTTRWLRGIARGSHEMRITPRPIHLLCPLPSGVHERPSGISGLESLLRGGRCTGADPLRLVRLPLRLAEDSDRPREVVRRAVQRFLRGNGLSRADHCRTRHRYQQRDVSRCRSRLGVLRGG